MIGTNPNITLPAGTDPLVTVVAKTAAALSALATSVADKATPAALNINGPLALAGNALTQVSTVSLVAGNSSQSPGSIYYGTDGEFYMVDGTGTAIKMTANGVINIGGTGGFVGDYVASNSTGAAFDLASGQFRFTKSAGASWADLVAANMILEGTSGTVKLGVDNAVTTAKTINVKSLPASGVSVLVYNAATSTLEDGAVTAPTNTVATITIGTLTTTADNKHTDIKHMSVPMAPAQSGVNVTVTDLNLVSSNTGWSYNTPVIPLRVGDRIKTIALTTTSGIGTVTVKLRKQLVNGTLGTIETWNVNFGGLGAQTITDTLASPVAIANYERWFLEFTFGSTASENILDISVGWDHP
jgi:hypothetical protein